MASRLAIEISFASQPRRPGSLAQRPSSSSGDDSAGDSSGGGVRRRAIGQFTPDQPDQPDQPLRPHLSRPRTGGSVVRWRRSSGEANKRTAPAAALILSDGERGVLFGGSSSAAVDSAGRPDRKCAVPAAAGHLRLEESAGNIWSSCTSRERASDLYFSFIQKLNQKFSKLPNSRGISPGTWLRCGPPVTSDSIGNQVQQRSQRRSGAFSTRLLGQSCRLSSRLPREIFLSSRSTTGIPPVL